MPCKVSLFISKFARGTCSCKWDDAADPEVLPMWVADMDFQTAPVIVKALQKRIAQGIYGYTHVPDEYYESVISWFKRRHGWSFSRDWMIYIPGIVPALSAIVKALTVPGDKVLIQTPVYNCFFSSIRNNGCEMVSNALVRDGNTFRIDFDDLEKKASDPGVKLMILCNPHNPAGRVWTREELTRIGEICIRNGVTVLADEIHCELVYPGHEYTPFASISDDFLHRSVTCVSPSKAFNIAGLQIANIVCANEAVRQRINEVINLHEINNVNPFGVIATIAAYNAVTKIDDFAYTPEQNISHAMTTFIAQNRGAGNKERAYKGFAKGLLIETVYFILLAAAVLALNKVIMHLFISGDGASAVIAEGERYLRTMAFLYVFPAFTNGIQGFFRGVGKMKTTLVGTCIQASLRVIFTFILVPHFGITGICYACAIGWVCMLAFQIPYYFYYKRRDASDL